MTGPNPVDRGKPGSKLHVLTDRGRLMRPGSGAGLVGCHPARAGWKG